MEQVLYDLPKGWEWKTLGDVCLKVTDGSHNPPKGVEAGLPMLSSRNVMDNGLVWDNFRLIPEDAFKNEHKRTRISEGDVLLTIVGTIGRSCVVRDLDKLFTLQRSVAVLSTEELVPEFLSYQFKAPFIQEHFVNNAKGSAQKGIYLKQLKATNLVCPPKEQQKRIVEKLDALLNRIDTAIEHLQESVTLKNSLLQSALDGQFSAITDRMTIESLAEVKGGKRLPKGEKLSDEETEHPYIRVADFTDKGTIDLSGIKYVSKEIHKQIKRYVISKDDLYISIAGTIGKTGFVPPELDGANLTENAAKLVIRDKQQLDLSYLYLFTLTSDFSAQAGLATKTVAQPKLALTRLSKIEIPMCSLEEQKSLISTIEALKSKIHDAEAVLLGKIEDLKSLKASILDSAFKGEL
ncbi:restriction endonuclease subunit S [Vibrio diabolicus]|nr:restriction endonuclease subunit S [Vibrio diabolicus]